MKLRRAHESDAIDILMWRNDPHTIAMCGSSAAVLPGDHYRWFQKALADPNRVFFIAMEGSRNLGVIRFDKSGDDWAVSINLRPDERGKGYGSAILKSGILRLSDQAGAVPLLADIKAVNTASIRIFEKCGFQKVGADGDMLHFVRPGH